MSILYRRPSIVASYQVSVHLAKKFQRRRLKYEQLMDDRRRTKDDGRRAPSDGSSSHCLWQGELTTVIGQICRSIRTHYSDSEPTSLCSFSLMLRYQRRSNKYQIYFILFDKTAVRTHNLGVSRRIFRGTHISFATLFCVVANEDLVNPGDVLAGMLSLISLFINA